MKTALQGRAPEDGSITPKPTAAAPSASICAVCGGPHETPAPIRFMRAMMAFVAEWQKKIAANASNGNGPR